MNHRYRAEIDGLRAVAVVPVLLFHADLGCSGGYVGVDVFFVISGYLITSLILKELAGDDFSLLRFWERRIRRILPALAVVVVSSIAVGWTLLLPQDFKELGQSVFAQSIVLANVYFQLKSGYFSQGVLPRPLLHTWSLAVEEQFYLVLPFLLLGFRRQSKSILLLALLLISSMSFAASVYCSYYHRDANYYLLPTRAWELLLGSLLAAMPSCASICRRRMAEFLSLAGLIGILTSAFAYDERTRFPGLAAMLPCFGTALIIWSNERALTTVGRILSNRLSVFVGLISYSLYLWHWPVLAFAEHVALQRSTVGERIGLLALSVALAILTWRFVETPCRTRRVLNRRSAVFAFAGVTTASLVAAGYGIHSAGGMPSRIPAESQRYASAASDLRACQLNSRDVARENLEELGKRERRAPVELLVWGDSHAMAMLPVFDLLCEQYDIRGVAATHSATAPLVGYVSRDPSSLLDDSIPFSDAVVEFIRRRGICEAVLIANWNFYVAADGGGAFVRDGFLNTIHALQDAGCRIWIMMQVPQQELDVPRALAACVLSGGDPSRLGVSLTQHRKASERIDAILSRFASPQVLLLDPVDVLAAESGSGLCRISHQGESLYADDDHLSRAGAMMLRKIIEPIFVEICNREVSMDVTGGDEAPGPQSRTPVELSQSRRASRGETVDARDVEARPCGRTSRRVN